MDFNTLIARINVLAHKKRTTGLTEAEKAEQKELYSIYLAGIRQQLKNQLDNIEVVDNTESSEEQH